MAIEFLISPAVSVINGSKTLNVTGSVNTYHVFNGTTIVIGNSPVIAIVEAVSGSGLPDGSGNSTITLAKPWALADVVSEPMVAFNTNEGFVQSQRDARDAANKLLAMYGNQELLLSSTNPTVSIEIVGVPTEFVPYQYLVDQYQSTLDGLGTAASEDVTTSTTDTTSGMVLTVGTAGLGSLIAVKVNDLNTTSLGSGFYEYDNTSLSIPTTVGGKLIIVSEGAGSASQLAIQNNESLFFRNTTSGATGFTPWREIYHSDNLNINEFGATSANEQVLRGYAANATTAVFWVDTNSFSKSSGISVTGTFSVRDASGAILASGLTPTFNLGASSMRTVVLNVTTGSVFTTGDLLTLRADSPTSKIEVNF